MADLTAGIQDPTAGNIVTPNYQAVSAADKFLASANQRYMLHWKNGATATTGAVYVAEKLAQAPAGAIPVNPPAPAIKWSDLLVIASTFPASTEKILVIDNITPYIDSLGFVNLLHGGTLTTLTVCILGPLS